MLATEIGPASRFGRTYSSDGPLSSLGQRFTTRLAAELDSCVTTSASPLDRSSSAPSMLDGSVGKLS
jgi:hypothetical protein